MGNAALAVPTQKSLEEFAWTMLHVAPHTGSWASEIGMGRLRPQRGMSSSQHDSLHHQMAVSALW